MKYVIDHQEKIVHEEKYTEERCGVADTPLEKGERTDSDSYIERLESKESYLTCPYCRNIHLIID